MVDPNARESILESLGSWSRSAAAGKVAEAERLRADFVDRFPIRSWPDLPLTEYALGQGTQDTVSYWLEYRTTVIGSIKGGSAAKHLIFFRRKEESWRKPKEYDSLDAAWSAIRQGFVEMLRLASDGEFDDADDIIALLSASAVRTKLLYMYFPEALLPISSKSDIDHYLSSVGESVAPSPIRGNRQLLAALRGIHELDDLSNQELGYFLYHWKNPRPSQRVVKIAPGELGRYWPECARNSYICVGWDGVGDLTQYETKEEFRNAFRDHYPYNGVENQVSRKANELWTLIELQPGDTVVANKGIQEVLAIGTVNDEGYVWRPEREEYKHTVGIDWDTSQAKKLETPVKGWATTTVSKVPATILRQITGTAANTFKPVETDEIFVEIEAALNRRGQVILYGPPGTGKTYNAKRAAVWLLDGGSDSDQANAMLADEELLAARERELVTAPSDPSKAARLTRVTFHPSYSYEDFIEGFRPQQATNGGMQLVLTPGAFKRVCDTARTDPTRRYVVLIDEINRGNIPKVFGELITLIEWDKRGATWQLPQSGAIFSVPENVLIIGTMNTADRSIHLLDTALRRRFQFIELLPDSSLLRGRAAGALALDDFLEGLNDKLRERFGRDKQIGHALFYVSGEIIDTPAEFAAVFRYDILPLLEEYYYDDYEGLADIVGNVIDTQAQRLAEIGNDPEALCDELANSFGTASA